MNTKACIVTVVSSMLLACSSTPNTGFAESGRRRRRKWWLERRQRRRRQRGQARAAAAAERGPRREQRRQRGSGGSRRGRLQWRARAAAVPTAAPGYGIATALDPGGRQGAGRDADGDSRSRWRRGRRGLQVPGVREPVRRRHDRHPVDARHDERRLAPLLPVQRDVGRDRAWSRRSARSGDCAGKGLEFHPFPFLSQQPDWTVSYPTDSAGMPMGYPLVGANYVMINVHYLNTTSETITANVSITITPAKAGVVKTHVGSHLPRPDDR